MAKKIDNFKDSVNGFTLMEVLFGMLVISFSMIALAQTFIYGNAFVEKFGFKRQAMIILDAEMEQMLAIKTANGQLDNPGPSDELSNRRVDFGRAGVTGALDVDVDAARFDNGLKYWEVNLSIRYGNSLFKDTARLSSRFYKEGAN